MLFSVIRSFVQGTRQLPPYDRWGAVTSELREDLEAQPEQPVVRLLGYLEGIDPKHQPEAIQDLIAEHMRFTWGSGGWILLEEYVQALGSRFDALADVVALPADLIEDEFLIRCALRHRTAPELEEYERRFPNRPDAIAPLRKRLLGGRYVKLQSLGRGATADVWEARDLENDRLVAIKQLRPEWLGRTEALDCFVLEARITARLDHPGIVRVHEFVQEPGIYPYLVQGLVRGRPLSELITDYHFPKVCRTRREKRELWRGLLEAFRAVCEALAHAHSRGVLHTDLKAANVVALADGRAVILDWGLARQVNGAAYGGTAGAVGTPETMAPEQVHGRADERSDVFGLGALLHELLTGRPLRTWTDGTRPADWRRIVLEQPAVSPRCLNARAPRGLAAICLGALAADPERRTGSVPALLDAFEAYCGAGARSNGAAERGGPWRFLELVGLDPLP